MSAYSHFTTKTRKNARRENGAAVSRMDGETLIREVTRKKHFVRKYEGYGLYASDIETLQSAGVKTLRFIERDTQAEYTITLAEFLANAITDNLGGYGLQYFIPVSKMSGVFPLEYVSHATVGAVYSKGGETVTAAQFYKQGGGF
jgi:hypothetical protein